MTALTQTGITRRDFLLYGSAGVTGTMAFALRPPRLPASQEGAPDLLVGYQADEGAAIVPARRLHGGDPALITSGARITVHGLGAEDESLPGGESLALFTHFAAAGDVSAKEVPVLCWSCTKEPVRSVGSTVSFIVPVSPSSGLKLSLKTGSTGLCAEARFTAGRELGRPKLRRGTYYLALSGAGRPREADVVVLSVERAEVGHPA